MQEFDLVIVGAGPAGCAAALTTAQLAPAVAKRTLVLEKAIFPRPKLCGGGITTHADALLRQLNVQLDVPSFPIHNIRVRYQDISFTFHWKNVFRTVRREEFDHALAKCVSARGIQLHEDEPLVDFEAREGGVDIKTNRGEYRARVVIGADGANSVVRRKVGLAGGHVSRLLEVLTDVDLPSTPEFKEHTAVFDFSPVVKRDQGYYWDFPSYKQGAAVMNRGIFDSRVQPARPRADLRTLLLESLAERKAEIPIHSLAGHPERWFSPNVEHSVPHILLAGDAAGTEPLFGEGISHALDFGRFAARTAVHAIGTEDYAFGDYTRRVAWSALGRRLRIKCSLARLLYAERPDWFYRLGFGFCRLVFGP